MPTKALYAGSFDPITRGHIDIVWKALQTFDEVVISIGTNPRKTRLFDVEESMELIRQSVKEWMPLIPHNYFPSDPERSLALRQRTTNWSVDQFTNKSLAAHAKEIGATHIVRGLRQISDFNDEFTLHGVLEKVDPTVLMVHLICDHEYLHVSSSTARELAFLKSNSLDWVVTSTVEKALREKFK